MRGSLFIIRPANRERLAEMMRTLPEGVEVNIREPGRTDSQNKKMWPMLTDVSLACPGGRKWSTETWKCAFMQRLGHEIKWVQGLDNDPLPLGFRSSKMSKRHFADLITCIAEYGDTHGVQWSEPNPYEVEQ